MLGLLVGMTRKSIEPHVNFPTSQGTIWTIALFDKCGVEAGQTITPPDNP
jgi:hypothetical protein